MRKQVLLIIFLAAFVATYVCAYLIVRRTHLLVHAEWHHEIILGDPPTAARIICLFLFYPLHISETALWNLHDHYTGR